MIDPQLILGIGSGALGAYVQLKKQAEQDRHQILMAALNKYDDSADKASKRGGSWGRRFAMFVVLSVGFGGLIYAAHSGIKVSQIVDREPIINLLNLIKIGGGQKVVEASGFVIPKYVEDSILSIIFFLFGSSAAKR